MNVRDAERNDAEAVLSVHRAAIAERGPRGYDDEVVEAWYDGRSVDDYRFGSLDEFLVAETAEDGVVGFGAAVPACRDHLAAAVDGEVTAVYVDPAFAGEGVGSTLLDALHDRLRARSVGTVAVWASLNAVGFYERRGYERVTTHRHEFADGVEGDVVELRRSL